MVLPSCCCFFAACTFSALALGPLPLPPLFRAVQRRRRRLAASRRRRLLLLPELPLQPLNCLLLLINPSFS